MKTVAFADIDAGVWGLTWDQLVTVAGHTLEATIDGDGAEADWRISGERLALVLSPDGDPAVGEDGFEQLCRVTGHVKLGDEQQLECAGRRAARPAPDLDRLDSIRDVCAWFGAGTGVTLTALRPRAAKGQEGDLVTATMFEDGLAEPVAAPRLSTTYDERGIPTRAGLELWLDDTEEAEQYPRRAAGEAAGDHLHTRLAPDLQLQARPFRWHFRGLDGSGVYAFLHRG